MDTEKDLIEAFESVLHQDFANPQRSGCPGNDSLAKFASNPGIPESAAVLAHLRQCAPCFDEVKRLRQRA